MQVRVVARHPFGVGGGVEILIGRDEDSRSPALHLIDTVDLDRYRELDRVIGSQFARMVSFMASAKRAGVTSGRCNDRPGAYETAKAGTTLGHARLCRHAGGGRLPM